MTGQFEPEGATAARVDLGSFPQAGVAVVFGASGGIGRALVEAIKAAEQFKHVVSFSRRTSPAIDLLDEGSLAYAAASAADRLQKQKNSTDRQTQRDLNKVNTAIKRCLTFITEGDGDPGIVRTKLKDLEVRKRDLEKNLTQSLDALTIETHPNLPDLYARKVEDLRSLLEDETARPQAAEIIRSMIDRIEVSECAKKGEPQVLLVGALAQILDYLQPTKNAASKGNGAGRVLLVAGVRNQRYLHLNFVELS